MSKLKLVAVASLVLSSLVVSVWRSWPPREGEIIFCDVGQGDGIIIQQGFTQVVVDGGPPNGQMSACLKKYLPWWDREIEMVVATHPDNDHIGGLAEMINQYHVDELMILPLTSDSTDFEALMRATSTKLQDTQLHVLIPNPG